MVLAKGDLLTPPRTAGVTSAFSLIVLGLAANWISVTEDETGAYFICECPARRAERRRVKAAAGKRWRNRAFPLTNEKGIAALMAYVKDTGRIRGKREDDGGRRRMVREVERGGSEL